MRKQVVVLYVVAAASLAAADGRVPHTLRMRVAQAPPDAGPDAPDDAPPDAPPDAAPPDAAPPDAAPPEPPAPAAQPPPEPEHDDGKTEVISITDRSAEHDLFIGPAPVTIVTRADLVAAGHATVGEVLQGIPAQGNAANAQVNQGGDGTTRINLRGLGAPRTLVLVNGRRFVNGGNGGDASVDINAIPIAMIERVEVMKDGEAERFGADAVGGVVNIILRPRFPGTDATVMTSTSQHGDGTELTASVVSGYTTLDKHTFLVLSGEYQHREPVLGEDRGFAKYFRGYDFTSRSETRTLSNIGPSGRLVAPVCPSGVCKPDGNGGWTDFTPADEYNEAATNYLYTPSQRITLLGTGGNRINNHMAFFGEGLYQRRETDRQLSPVPFTADAVISKDSIYNPLGTDLLDFRRRMTELGPRQYTDEVSTIRFVGGLQGDTHGWTWEAAGNYAYTKSTASTSGQLIKLRLRDALGPSMIGKDGAPICVKTPGDESTQIIYHLPNGDLPPIPLPCVPLNILAPNGTIPADQLKNLSIADGGIGEDIIQGVVASAKGPLAKLPHHGEITLATGAEYRYDKGYQAPPTLASVGDDYSTDLVTKATDGRAYIGEGYAELAVVPIARDEIARHLELDLGARALHHSKFGSHLTYKVGGLFRTIGGLALRSTYATAFRAPSVRDKFGGTVERLTTVEDPCDTTPPSAAGGPRTLAPGVQAQCTAQNVPTDSKFGTVEQLTRVGGNPDLTPETAGTVTAGIVLEPPIVPGLAITADYWRIAIDNAIETLGVAAILANCYERGEQAFCDQIKRDPVTHRIAPVDQILQNVHRTTTSGIDVAVWYEAGLGPLGRLRNELETQILLGYDLDTGHQVVHGLGNYDLGVYPRVKANLTSRWAHPSGVSGGFALRFVGTYQECAANDCNDHPSTARDVGNYATLDLFGSYDFGLPFGRSAIQVGVNNALDAEPPTVYNAAAASSDAATYDFIGRMFYLRMSQQF